MRVTWFTDSRRAGVVGAGVDVVVVVLLRMMCTSREWIDASVKAGGSPSGTAPSDSECTSGLAASRRRACYR